MSNRATEAATPRYVVMDGDVRVGPKVTPPVSSQIYSPIYGFSDRRAYERFWMDNQGGLVPYPLVKGFLQNRDVPSSEPSSLIVVDASGPQQSVIRAATTKEVLAAQVDRASHVPARHTLTFDPKTGVYRIDEFVE